MTAPRALDDAALDDVGDGTWPRAPCSRTSSMRALMSEVLAVTSGLMLCKKARMSSMPMTPFRVIVENCVRSAKPTFQRMCKVLMTFRSRVRVFDLASWETFPRSSTKLAMSNASMPSLLAVSTMVGISTTQSMSKPVSRMSRGMSSRATGTDHLGFNRKARTISFKALSSASLASCTKFKNSVNRNWWRSSKPSKCRVHRSHGSPTGESTPQSSKASNVLLWPNVLSPSAKYKAQKRRKCATSPKCRLSSAAETFPSIAARRSDWCWNSARSASTSLASSTKPEKSILPSGCRKRLQMSVKPLSKPFQKAVDVSSSMSPVP
mmetsp:Transcript_163136/g.523127  ORF Transcript_163136/g.523127 Transcript_163136/m.523127 type:complete len:322 (-) Transcript_163136:1863-2828(-)